MTDAIAILKETARGLKQALDAKGYPASKVRFAIGTNDEPYVLCYATDWHFTLAVGETVEEIVTKALVSIERDIRPAVDPRLASWFGEAA
jgi:hypothetical protein